MQSSMRHHVMAKAGPAWGPFKGQLGLIISIIIIIIIIIPVTRHHYHYHNHNQLTCLGILQGATGALPLVALGRTATEASSFDYDDSKKE